MADFREVVMGRKSVRTYDGRDLTPEDRAKIEACAAEAGAGNPFGIPVEFKFLGAEEYGLSSPVLSGEKLYVAGIVDKVPYSDVAFGYSMEQLVLYAWSLGIGTVWIGGTMKRENFEKAAGLTEGRRMPCISPVGYPASKRALKETLMRKGVKADERKPLGELFFDGDWESPLTEQGAVRKAMELVRWAPSAVNKQPWRIIRKDGAYHFFLKHNKGYVSDEVGDMQKIDIGIALCHFTMGLEDEGLEYTVTINDPAIEVNANMEYIATVEVQ
jgi:nitroreductase